MLEFEHALSTSPRLVPQIQTREIAMLFLDDDEIRKLTGRAQKRRQIEALRQMGIPFWVNALGEPIVTTAAVEGRKDPPQAPSWRSAILG